MGLCEFEVVGRDCGGARWRCVVLFGVLRKEFVEAPKTTPLTDATREVTGACWVLSDSVCGAGRDAGYDLRAFPSGTAFYGKRSCRPQPRGSHRGVALRKNTRQACWTYANLRRKRVCCVACALSCVCEGYVRWVAWALFCG